MIAINVEYSVIFNLLNKNVVVKGNKDKVRLQLILFTLNVA